MIVVVILVTTVALLAVHTARQKKIYRNGRRLSYANLAPDLYNNSTTTQWLISSPFKSAAKHIAPECGHQFGLETYEISVPTLPPGVVISDPKNVEYALKHEELFAKGDFFKERSWDLFGNGIINVDGPLWKAQRKAGLYFFRTANLKVLVDVALPIYLADTRTLLEKRVKDHDLVDLEHVFLDLTTRLFGKIAYNMDMDASSPFSNAFDFASGATGERFQNPLWKLTEFFFGARFRAAIQQVKSFGNAIVAAAIHNRRSSDGKIEDNAVKKKLLNLDTSGEDALDQIRGSLINAFLDEVRDPEIVSDAALNFLSAEGRDTTAQALTWTFHLLMRHPRVLERIRRELHGFAREDGNLQLSFESVQPSSMPYITAVFYESLRLYPPVPFEIKQCTASTTLPDGTSLGRGAIVLWCAWAMGRSESLWGEDPDSFRPERWLEDTAHDDPQSRADSMKEKIKVRSPYEFPVFNGGPRTCLGKRLAELLAVYVIASLVTEYDFEEEKRSGCDGIDRVSRNSLTLPMEGGLPCRVCLANSFGA
ncbi:MAG: hypothetical protein M1833_005184 [Piccolia ochrophora]|nr:MAG: hypothetical protein M1833_005184 [Piccolia ochrophora]